MKTFLELIKKYSIEEIKESIFKIICDYRIINDDNFANSIEEIKNLVPLPSEAYLVIDQ
ncbi:hypothetical protein ACQR2L_05060 [Clostridium butyricum]|uniref:hypothetical protein n=1 Tax=Clostridium butyricum TaxID=1492 RepID=UPI003D10F3C2